jgi:RNA 3'-terminal phosphate cyclase (ATP)
MSSQPVELDGRRGTTDSDGNPGQGQVLRSALSLSLATGTPFVLEHIRTSSAASGSVSAGLLPLDLSCIKAAQTVGQAEVEGAEAGSTRLTFRPHPPQAGDYLLDAAGANPASLLLQTLCFPLALTGQPSTLKLRGGTHVPRGPSLHYLMLVWTPMMRSLGFSIEMELERAGFAPEGGGEVTVRVLPAESARTLGCSARGTLLEAHALAMIAGVPISTSERLSGRAEQKLLARGILPEVETLPLAAPRSRGAGLLVHARFEHSWAGYESLYRPGHELEQVADEAVQGFLGFMASGGAVDEHLADQLVLPLALSASGLQGGTPGRGRYTTGKVTSRLLAQAELMPRFLPVRVAVRGDLGSEGEVIVAPEAALET